MSTPEEDTGGTVWDAPNQQVVRPDESAPWDEGTGGGTAGPKKTAAKRPDSVTSDKVT
jgi:hypothetical protein